jgi:hypothetical protein
VYLRSIGVHAKWGFAMLRPANAQETWPGERPGASVEAMTRMSDSSCCVCTASDARSLVEITLAGGKRVTLCGSHALMHRRSPVQAKSLQELRLVLGERRRRRERRSAGDALGDALAAAFAGDRRAVGRRRA